MCLGVFGRRALPLEVNGPFATLCEVWRGFSQDKTFVFYTLEKRP